MNLPSVEETSTKDVLVVKTIDPFENINTDLETEKSPNITYIPTKPPTNNNDFYKRRKSVTINNLTKDKIVMIGI